MICNALSGYAGNEARRYMPATLHMLRGGMMQASESPTPSSRHMSTGLQVFIACVMGKWYRYGPKVFGPMVLRYCGRASNISWRCWV